MHLDPMDGPPAGNGHEGGRPKEIRFVVAAVSVVLIWVLTTSTLGPGIGAATALLAGVLVPAFLFRHYIRPSHLPYLLAFGAPVLLVGLWVS